MVYNANQLLLMDFEESPFEGHKWVCRPLRINGLGPAWMDLLSVPREPNDMKDWVLSPPGLLGMVVHSAFQDVTFI